mmetsp:Transcript_31123/g.82830  ORF Transcript_31123/g.82830 Transcript_31123/m.82830 type:complete len:232 (+) Transcript_31123:565-1260(+)
MPLLSSSIATESPPNTVTSHATSQVWLVPLVYEQMTSNLGMYTSLTRYTPSASDARKYERNSSLVAFLDNPTLKTALTAIFLVGAMTMCSRSVQSDWPTITSSEQVKYPTTWRATEHVAPQVSPSNNSSLQSDPVAATGRTRVCEVQVVMFVVVAVEVAAVAEVEAPQETMVKLAVASSETKMISEKVRATVTSRILDTSMALTFPITSTGFVANPSAMARADASSPKMTT